MERFDLTEDSGLICVELVTKIHQTKCRIREVPVHHFHRMHGRSQFFNIQRVLRVLLGMAGLWWRIFIQKDLGSRTRFSPDATAARRRADVPEGGPDSSRDEKAGGHG
jgi:hypothetical protein